MAITAEMKMADVIHSNIQLLSVIQGLNIQLRFREKSVGEICAEQNIDVNFVLQLTNVYNNEDYFPSQELLNFPVNWIVEYLRNTHDCLVCYRIPDIERQITELEEEMHDQVKNIDLLLKFFKDYIKEFNAHIGLEEELVFPYILTLHKLTNNEVDIKEVDPEIVKYSIDKYMEDHNDIEEKLYDLKSILLKYLPHPPNNYKFNNLVFEIFRLESDLNDHTKMEERVLIPKVKQMEKEFHQQNR